MKKVYSVSNVNKYIKMMFDKDPVLADISIKGEITNFKAHYTGHLYFTLKDSSSTIKCVMFKSARLRLRFMLENGMKAPDFTLCDQNGNKVSLSDFTGQRVVLYFYPKDNTPGCTRQACAFAASYEAFKSLDVAVIGVSKDSVASHVKFAEKFNLPFILLSDPELQAIEPYGVWQEKKMCGKTCMGVVRTTFIIDENGVITHVMPKVKPDTNAAEILALLGK